MVDDDLQPRPAAPAAAPAAIPHPGSGSGSGGTTTGMSPTAVPTLDNGELPVSSFPSADHHQQHPAAVVAADEVMRDVDALGEDVGNYPAQQESLQLQHHLHSADLLVADDPSPERLEFADFDVDSAVDVASHVSSTMSVTSSIAEKLEENGRTYHSYKEGKYMLPNDESELNRLDIQHKMWEITLEERLHLAPIGPSPHDVLDIGTGSGNWAIDFAAMYPSAHVIGTDLSVVQPEYVPTNCEFQIDDAEDEWMFSRPFDYVHGRALATCFKDPASIFRKAFASLRPRGFFEMQDVVLQESEDGSIRGTALEEIQLRIAEATAASGRLWTNVPRYAEFMRAAGFEDVTVATFRWPSNDEWPDDPKEKLLGRWFLHQVDSGLLENVTTRIFLMKLGWEKERLDAFLATAKRDLRDKNLRVYSPVLVVYGRKPGGDGPAETVVIPPAHNETAVDLDM